MHVFLAYTGKSANPCFVRIICIDVEVCPFFSTCFVCLLSLSHSICQLLFQLGFPSSFFTLSVFFFQGHIIVIRLFSFARIFLHSFFTFFLFHRHNVIIRSPSFTFLSLPASFHDPSVNSPVQQWISDRTSLSSFVLPSVSASSNSFLTPSTLLTPPIPPLHLILRSLYESQSVHTYWSTKRATCGI